MTLDGTLIICGECTKVHTPAKPPMWDYTEIKTRARCVDCDEVMIQIPNSEK